MVLALASAAAGAAPYIKFSKPGDTYAPSTLTIMSSTEGTRPVEFPGDSPVASGFSLAAAGTRLEGTDQGPLAEIDGVPGIGLVPIGNADACSSSGGTLGRNPGRYGVPRRNGLWHRVTWTWSGCSGYPQATWRVADGVTTYSVSRLKRVYRPAVWRTIWADQGNGDEYFNVCLAADNIGSVRQSGGRRYCRVLVREKIDRTTYRLTQRTTITKVYPAYVTP